MNTTDVIVVGGGMLGPAIAYGLARAGVAVTVLDEGDDALRAARGNFGLVWYQGKGLGRHRYSEWTLESTRLWPDFAAELRDETGVDVGHHRPGGLDLCLGEEELARRQWQVGQLRQQAGDAGYECEMVDADEVRRLLPGTTLGDAVSGASFSPHDGHVNPLFLLRALHQGLVAAGGRFVPGQRVVAIERAGGDFAVRTESARFSAPRVVLAAGHGVSALGPMVGLGVPIRPERGQILITERVAPFLALPMSRFRQTDEGTIMLGDSNEDVGFDDTTSLGVTGRIARDAVRTFPALARLRMVRTWAALRILTSDKFPVYAESPTHPGAFVAVTHSGVTLAAVHARRLAPWIAGGPRPEGFDAFSLERFDVPSPATA